MHSEESVLICGSSDDIGENPEFEGEERCVSEVDSSADLEESDEEDDPFCQRFVTHQLCHLWMSLHDCLSPTSVWFLCHHPQEI